MLSNTKILKYINEGKIIIHPFEPKNLGSNSYDVTLGDHYYREQRPELLGHGLLPVEAFEYEYNPYIESEVKEVWGDPQIADYGQILIAPGETILAHTNEFIGGVDNITSMMKARSSWGRNFIEVCKCAGLGDVGYFNRWTMEITNNSRYYHIPLIVGRRVAQITFFKTGEANQYSDKGKYQNSHNLDEVIAKWKPDMMLPKLYNDWELL